MPQEYVSSQTPGQLKSDFLSRIARFEVLIVFALASSGFAIVLISLTLLVKVTPSANFGESIEGVVPASYWMGIAIMIASICYMLSRLDQRNFRVPFLISCAMLLFSMRSVLAIISPLPYVQDVWGFMYLVEFWRKYGLFSPIPGGLLQTYSRGWPVSFVLAYFITSAGIPVYVFFKWAPTVIITLDLIVIYFLFKELTNEKIGMASAFLFTLLNTDGFFPLHYSPQTLGALFYLVAMYALIKAHKTRRLKHLGLALLSIFVATLTHHMTTFFLGVSLAGIYVSRYVPRLQKKMPWINRRFGSPVKLGTFVKLSLPLSFFTFALWYFYGFIVYRIDAISTLTQIMKLLTTGQKQYGGGDYTRYLSLSPLMQLSILIFPAFIVTTSAIFLIRRIRKKESLDGYLLFTGGWAVALAIAFILGNMLHGNYIEPLRVLEVLTVALFPVSALFLLSAFGTKSLYRRGLITILLISVGVFSVFSIYRAAQSIVYFQPPSWWWFNPP